MSKFFCITNMIRLMMKEAEKLMNGYVHEDDIFIVHDDLVLMKVKETITWMKENNYFLCWLIPTNGLQYGKTDAGRPVGNIPVFMPLDNSLNKDILHILRFHCVLSRFVLDGEGNNEEERNMYFILSTPKEIDRGIKSIWESKMGTPSSARMIQDVDLTLKELEIAYYTNGYAVERLADRNGHRQKVAGEGKSVGWGGERTKGKGSECKLTKNMFLHSDLLKLYLKKNTTSLSSSLTQLCFTIITLDLRGNGVNI